MRFTTKPETNKDGSAVTAEQRIGRLRDWASLYSPSPAGLDFAKQAAEAQEEARLAREPRRWERH